MSFQNGVMGFMKKLGLVGGLLVIAGLIVGLGSWYTVDQGERGVILRNGAFVGTAEPGLGFKIPLMDSVVRISVQTRTYTWDKMNSYSADQQPADLKVSVTFRVEPGRVNEVYSEFGSVEAAVSRLISPVVNRDVKIVFGNFTAVRAIQERGKLNVIAKDTIVSALKDAPLVVESVQIESIDFSPDYIKSVEARMQAEVEVQRVRQEAEREKVTAQITVTKAQARADATLAQARAEADATRIRGEAQAAAIKARGEALRDNPALISLVQAERWNGALPTTMVPNASVPMLTMK